MDYETSIAHHDKTTKEKLVPLPGRILMEQDPFKYEGLITIPDKAKRRPTTGTVVAIGEGVTKVSVGERILCAQFSGTGIQIKNFPAYVVLTEEEVLLKLAPDIEIDEVSATG